ncbi:unnamed protein product [Cuscuta campestris]|uniref:feruloyl-CoA 6-hydroxylase n=1 Tax=Cuscuta campestris TaxID=132261 RepID=A0A484NRF3_9ASTE|nr:unnamed protein product [Cuscuta campestris]
MSRKLIKACEEWGCFRVYNHHSLLPPSLTAEMKEVSRSLFDLPPEAKTKIGFVPPFSGYWRSTPEKPENPLREAFGLYDISSPPDVEAFCAQIHASDHQRETIVKYAKAVHETMMEIARRLCEGLGVKGELFEGWPCALRMFKYNFTPDSIGSCALKTHTDTGFLTLLENEESVGGLEIMNNKSGEFVAVDPCPGTILINIGDTAALWSNGRFCSVKHRVMCKEATDRFSVVSGILGHGDCVIQPPPELIEPPHLRRLYVPVTYNRLRELRRDNKMHAGEVLDLLRA